MLSAVADLGRNEANNKAQIDQYARDVGQPWFTTTPTIEAWCAMFAGSHLKRHGYRIPDGIASVRAAEYDQRIATKVINPQYGDLVLLNYGNKGPVDHVTFFVDFLTNGLVKCLGGNQSASVKYSNFKASDVHGYYRPVKVTNAPEAPRPVEPPARPVDPTGSDGDTADVRWWVRALRAFARWLRSTPPKAR
jgi:hypothetical protein